MITQGERWVLNIDPQTQANNWIKESNKPHLIMLDMKDNGYIKKMEKAVTTGKCVLLQDVGEELDPSLDNIFSKTLIKQGNEFYVKIGENEVQYNPKFKLYITTRLPNPTYTPEVSTKVNVVNFSIKEQGLQEQCLGIVVELKQPAIEKHKNDLIEKIEKFKNERDKCADDILTSL